MRIVIDLQGAQTESRFRGIGRYSMAFAQAIVRNRGEHEVFIALSGLFPDTIEPIRAAFDGLLPQENIRVWYAPGPVRECDPGNSRRREAAELIREAFLASLRPDVIHISSLFEGYVDDAITSIRRFDPTTPVSVSLYDLIPLLNPDQYLKPHPIYEQYYLRKVGHLRQAGLLLAISEFSRLEGIEHLDAPVHAVVNVSTAADDCFRPVSSDEESKRRLRDKFRVTAPFILYTGGSDERKNLPRLIAAYAQLSPDLRKSHQLVLAGKMSEGCVHRLQGVAKAAGLHRDKLLFTGYVADEELVGLYSLCKLFVFPSWHEGFGLPALEAMACGAPVIGANTSSLPEVIGLDAALFDPFDVASIAAKMDQALGNGEFRAMLREHGLQQAKRFSWDESAKRAIAAMESLSKNQNEQLSAKHLLVRKPRLAFVSPLPPERTGIADYSAELLPALAQYYDIEVVVAQGRVDDSWVHSNAHVRDVSWFRYHSGTYDRVLYQMGNSPFHQHMLSLLREIPGTVVLHDFYLSGLMAWLELHAGATHVWTKALYAAHGYGAVRARYQDAEAAKRDYPVNFDVLQHAHGIIVHSDYSRRLASQWHGHDMPIDWVVIPSLRSPATSIDKTEARSSLGFSADDFIICSFGFLDPTKLNHQLLNCWLASALAQDKRCHLVFVGEKPGGEYGDELLLAIKRCGLDKRIQITGFSSQVVFRQYLMASDLAVQLRTQSRGETSAAVLDCMNYALPLIVNANGSMAELDRKAVWMLPDEFDDEVLIEALEDLWRQPEKRHALGERARAIILDRHAPAECARHYREAIESFHRRRATFSPALSRAIANNCGGSFSDPELLRLSRSIAATLPLVRPAKRLLLDVTATCRNDLKTGIERVARALLLALIEAQPPGYRIEPVYLDNVQGEWLHRYARRYTLDLLGCAPEALDDEVVEPECGDILLGLDLSGAMLVQAQKEKLFANYRNIGVAVYSLVFDLLPIRIPEVFPPGADQAHLEWLLAVSDFDGAVCISKSVADDLAKWRNEEIVGCKDRRPYQIGWIHLGADVGNSVPSSGLPDGAELTLTTLKSRSSFLMVGTIEPRKGYLQTIESFTHLWEMGIEANLVIVGREGWKGLPDEMRRDIPETIRRLRSHHELNKRLFWLEGVSDEFLEKIYSASTCLIAASYGEGFGLPLIEAAQHKLPIIARDIPVFREVAGECAYYFPNDRDHFSLSKAIQNWLELFNENRHLKSDDMFWITWGKCAENLKSLIIKK